MDIHWKNADKNELRALEAIKILLEGHEKLLNHIFHPTEARLNAEPRTVLDCAQCFSSGEYILIQVALDFWDGSGKASLSDIYGFLDRAHYIRVLKSIEFLKWPQ